jgi:hypothetical protein
MGAQLGPKDTKWPDPLQSLLIFEVIRYIGWLLNTDYIMDKRFERLGL